MYDVGAFFQLKMRTGGVEQARMSRRKKSPKPKPKKTKQGHTPQSSNQSSSTDIHAATGSSTGSSQGQGSHNELGHGRQGGQSKESDSELALREEVENFGETDKDVSRFTCLL